MDILNFRLWLERRYPTSSTPSNRVANAKKVNRYFPLEDAHNRDAGVSLLNKLTVSRKDINTEQIIPFNGDYYNGMATLKQAAKLYFEFRKTQS